MIRVIGALLLAYLLSSVGGGCICSQHSNPPKSNRVVRAYILVLTLMQLHYVETGRWLGSSEEMIAAYGDSLPFTYVSDQGKHKAVLRGADFQIRLGDNSSQVDITIYDKIIEDISLKGPFDSKAELRQLLNRLQN